MGVVERAGCTGKMDTHLTQNKDQRKLANLNTEHITLDISVNYLQLMSNKPISISNDVKEIERGFCECAM